VFRLLGGPWGRPLTENEPGPARLRRARGSRHPHILPDRLDGSGDPDKRKPRVVARPLININVIEARRRLAQAHLTRPRPTGVDRCQVQNLVPASLPNLNRMRPQGFHLFFITENRQFHKFIIVTMILPYQHDCAICWEEVFGVL
jgi:hypothetical protein